MLEQTPELKGFSWLEFLAADEWANLLFPAGHIDNLKLAVGPLLGRMTGEHNIGINPIGAILANIKQADGPFVMHYLNDRIRLHSMDANSFGRINEFAKL